MITSEWRRTGPEEALLRCTPDAHLTWCLLLLFCHTPFPRQVTRANNLTEGFWLFEIIFTLLEQSVRLQRLNAPVGVRAVVDSFSTAAIASASLPAGVAAARSVAVRTFIRNLCDLPIACHFLQLGPFATHPHGHFGLLGVASSAISLYDLWPTITVAVPAKTV